MSIFGPGADYEFESDAVMGWELEKRDEQFFACVKNGNKCNQRVHCDR